MNDQFGVVRALSYPIKSELYPRTGHRIILVDQQILIFGGLSSNNDYNTTIIKVDCETMTPDLMRSRNQLKLYGFSIFHFQSAIYFWGGSGPSKLDYRLAICNNKLQRFINGGFEVCQQKGRIPAGRENHASCVVPNKGLIIMGGNNGKYFFDDWHLLDFKTMTWHQLKIDSQLPIFLDSLLFWKAGRGFLLSGERLDSQKRLLKENKLYQFKFSDYKEKKIHIEPIQVTSDSKQCFPRGSPVACLATLESPYIVLIGGIKSVGVNSMSICNSVQCFNIQTLQWFPLNHAPEAGSGFEAVYSHEKIYMVGGLNPKSDLFQAIEYIQLKIDYLESKICRSCRQLYGLRNMALDDQKISIKYEMSQYPKSFLSSEIVGKFSYYMNYPFSAIGLLIDNSLNLSGSNIDIDFKKLNDKQNIERRQAFDYISITDNSMGFSSYQILDSLCSFSIKTQKYTNDKRYEEQMQIKKQYGLNLKLAALRLGKNCLFMTKVDEKEQKYRLIAYFSAASCFSSEPFTVTYYMLSQQGQCTSQVARHLIERNVSNKIPKDYETQPVMTLIYIFDFENQQMELRGESMVSIYPSSKIFRCLQDYIESLYLKPYLGRSIKINGKAVKFRNYLELLKADEQDEKIVQVDRDDYELVQNQDYISKIKIYKHIDKAYHLRDILCFHKNRLLYTIKGLDERYCGIVQFSQHLKIDICKTRLENRAIQMAVNHRIRSIMLKYRQKRSMPLVVKSLNSPMSRLFQSNYPQ